MHHKLKPGDLASYEEISLALAQATMHQAIEASGLDRGAVAMRFYNETPRPACSTRRRWSLDHFNRLFDGDSSLTVRDMGRLFAICGFEIRFNRIPRLKLDRTGKLQSKMLLSSTYGRQDLPGPLTTLIPYIHESGNGFRHYKPSWLRKGVKVQSPFGFGDVFVVEMVRKASKQRPAFFVARRLKSKTGLRESMIVSCTADVMRSWVQWEG